MTIPITSGFRESAKYIFVGEAPGREEDQYGRPLIGPSGHESYAMLEEARWVQFGAAKNIVRNLHPWYDPDQKRMRISNPNFLPLDKTLDESSIFLTNVCHVRPPNNEIGQFFASKTDAKRNGIPLINGRFPEEPIRDGIEQLRKDIETIRPTIIVALGGTALWTLTGLEGITKWRGSILRVEGGPVGNFGIKLIAMYHPADILREWSHRFVAVRDLKRAYIERNYPEIREKPKRYIVRPSYAEAMEWIAEQSAPERAEEPLGADIETPWGWWSLVGHIACMGFSTSRSDAICIPLMCVDDKEGYWPPDQETNIVLAMRHLMTTRPLFFHKGVFDVMHIIRHWGFVPRWTDDTMVMQHVRFPGLMGGDRIDPVTGKVGKKGSSLSLVFCASMYCEYYRAWKDDGKNWNQQEIPDEDGWWSYNCVRGDTWVETNQGWYTIDVIVNNRMRVHVKTINEKTKRIEWKPIINWHRNDYTDKITWMAITVVKSHGQRQTLICTYDHEILGPFIGRKDAALIVSDDLIYSEDLTIDGIVDNTSVNRVVATASFLSDDNYDYSNVSYCISVQDNKNFLTPIGFISNCDDTTYMYEVFEVLQEALHRENLYKQYRFMMSLSGPVIDMMLRGFPLDHDLLREFRYGKKDETTGHYIGGVRNDIKELQAWINDVCGHEVNTGSAPQMMKLFYEDLRVKKVMKGRGRDARPTLNVGALKTIARRSPIVGPLCYAMADERSLSHFDENMLSIRLSDDGCAHTEVNITGTETLRFTSTEDCFGTGLNMQNINRMPED